MLGEIYPHSRGVIPQVRVDALARELARNRWNSFVKVDIRDFYPSINHNTLVSVLNQRVKKAEFIELILRAIRTPTVADGARRNASGVHDAGVPQGLAISNLLAEIYLAPLDDQMVADPRCSYFRFVDDVVILCDQGDADMLFTAVADTLSKFQLIAHSIKSDGGKSQIGSLSNRFGYLGYEFHGGRISVRQASVVLMESRLAREFTSYRKDLQSSSASGMVFKTQRFEWHLNLAITGCVYKGAPRGWLHYFRQMDDLTTIKKLDVAVARFAHRFGVTDLTRVKTFMKAYWAIRYPHRHHGYIPNFDTFTVQDMRDELLKVGHEAANSPNEWTVRNAFFRLIDKSVTQLETDIGAIY